MHSVIGYAHIDYDIHSNRHYLSICVLTEHQTKGIGTKLMDILLKLFTDDIFLTVDTGNTIAIKLYEKYGFVSIENNNNYIIYKRSKDFVLPISLGEAVDKLTILDIKLEKIKDNSKQIDCKKEFDSIHLNIYNYIRDSEYSYLYKWLKYINNEIWVLQDNIREYKLYSKENFNRMVEHDCS
jgi:hypothetical protein